MNKALKYAVGLAAAAGLTLFSAGMAQAGSYTHFGFSSHHGAGHYFGHRLRHHTRRRHLRQHRLRRHHSRRHRRHRSSIRLGLGHRGGHHDYYYGRHHRHYGYPGIRFYYRGHHF